MRRARHSARRTRSCAKRRRDDAAAVNVLDLHHREAIIELKARGATLREIAATVGVHRETVRKYLDARGPRQRRMAKLLDAIAEELRARGIAEPLELEPFIELYDMLHMQCAFHAEADWERDFEQDGSCRLCRSDGLKRHHTRRKADGKPILPPWQRDKKNSAADP